MVISDPEIENVMSSPSASVAVTVPIAVWFSSALNEADEVITGALPFSSTSIIVIVTSLVTVSVPSVKVSVIEYDVLVS